MDFAKKELEKYGWQEGSGLGKNSSGISVPVKPNLKFDNAGLGHNASEEFSNNWWETLYNKSADNIKVTIDNEEVKIGIKDMTATDISTKNNPDQNKLKYGTFIKTTESGITELAMNMLPITDEDLFAACKGRTAYKGMHHGLKQIGKLSRLEIQEKVLLRKLNKVSVSNEVVDSNKMSIEKKLKKIKYHKGQIRSDDVSDTLSTSSPCILNVNSPHKNNKKRKSERKQVSFNETVVEYHTQENDSNEVPIICTDLDGSCSDGTSRSVSPVTKVKEVQIKDNDENPNTMVTDLDDDIQNVDYDGTKEKTKLELQEKIKKDNSRMKRKLKKLRNLIKNPTNLNNNKTDDRSDMSIKWAKRKLFEEAEPSNSFSTKRCHYAQTKVNQQNQPKQIIDAVTDSFNSCKI
ncbi:hypothetical protein FQA39_LY09536 [Lamprigera yunnana]|nr:hypothetical protein FQA39_LY09536 [Lamprigera yunnana]